MDNSGTLNNIEGVCIMVGVVWVHFFRGVCLVICAQWLQYPYRRYPFPYCRCLYSAGSGDGTCTPLMKVSTYDLIIVLW